jgi:hypothetical protein
MTTHNQEIVDSLNKRKIEIEQGTLVSDSNQFSKIKKVKQSKKIKNEID